MEITMKTTLKATPAEIYNAWLNSEGHTNMTGAEAECTNIEGDSFSAWEGYISGRNLALTMDKEIIQSWRTTDFKDTDEDSTLIIRLEAINSGTELTLVQTNIPEGQAQYEKGWIDFYFEPMKKYFSQ